MDLQFHAGWALVSFLLGGLAGFSEVVSRYKDDPLRAVGNRFGFSYIAFNGLLSLAAYWLLLRYQAEIFPELKDPFLIAVVAGFGSMVVFRSKLFTFVAEDGKEISVGPVVAMESLLGLLDREIDRLRAAARHALVFNSMKEFKDFEVVAKYLEASLLAFHSLSPEDKNDIADIIDQYRKLEDHWPAELRIVALGLTFLTLAGEANFSQVIDSLRKFVATGDQEPVAKSA